ncbi:DUF2953 domain-containing protein [Oscillospiraceae bacterium PP1C4]
MAIAGYALLGLLALVVLLLCIPVAIMLRYRTDEPPQAYLRWLILRFDLYRPNKPEKAKPVPKQETKPEPKPAKREPMEFSELLGAAVDLLSAAKGGTRLLIRQFRIYMIRLHLVVAQGDAAQTAITYGKVNAGVYGTYALAKNFLNMGEPDIEIRPDFIAEEGSVDFELRGRLLPIVAVAAAIRIGCSFLVKTIRRKKMNAQQDEQQ